MLKETWVLGYINVQLLIGLLIFGFRVFYVESEDTEDGTKNLYKDSIKYAINYIVIMIPFGLVVNIIIDILY